MELIRERERALAMLIQSPVPGLLGGAFVEHRRALSSSAAGFGVQVTVNCTELGLVVELFRP